MPNKLLNPQEECLRALRELTQLDNGVYFPSSVVNHQVYHNGLNLPENIVKVNLEFFVCAGDAERVIISRGYAARNGNPRHKALYAYKASDRSINQPSKTPQPQ